jgi:hypothetical protein
MCAYGARLCGNLQRAGVTGHALTVMVSDLLRSRRPFRLRRLLLGTENRAAEQHAAGCLTCGIACVQCPRPQVSA